MDERGRGEKPRPRPSHPGGGAPDPEPWKSPPQRDDSDPTRRAPGQSPEGRKPVRRKGEDEGTDPRERDQVDR